MTVALLAVTAVLALLSDYVRIRSLRQMASGSSSTAKAMSSKTSSMAAHHILVPELPAQPEVSGGRASRLAAALKQPRRELSAGARAAIERGSQLAAPPREGAGLQTAGSLQRIG